MNQFPLLALCPSKHYWSMCKTRVQGWKAFLALILFQAVFHAILFTASKFLIWVPQNWFDCASPFFFSLRAVPDHHLSKVRAVFYIPVGTICTTCHIIVKYKYELSVCINGLVPQTSEFLTFTSNFPFSILLICIPNTADDTTKIYFSRIWSAQY